MFRFMLQQSHNTDLIMPIILQNLAFSSYIQPSLSSHRKNADIGVRVSNLSLLPTGSYAQLVLVMLREKIFLEPVLIQSGA